MASSVTIAQINTLMHEVGPQVVQDAITRSVKLWDLIANAGGGLVGASSKSGPFALVKVGSNGSATSFEPGGSMTAADAAEIVEAKLNWGNYGGMFTLSELGLAQLESGGEQELANAIQANLEELARQLQSAVNTGLISGSDTSKDIIGICTAIDDTNNYAGIDRSSKTEWGCYVAANSGSARGLTVAIMDTAYDYFVNTVGAEAGNWVILTGTAQESTMRGFSTGAASSYSVYQPGEGVVKALSTSKVAFRDIPVVAIPGYTTGRIDFVNLDACSIECLNGAEAPFRFSGPHSDAGSDLTYFKGFFQGQLVIKNIRHNCFSIQDLS